MKKKIRLATWLTVNRACNLRCEWCYAAMTGFDVQDTMSLKTADISVRAMKDIGVESVILIGGEPTIHPYFFEIVEIVKTYGLNCYLVTNALRFADKRFLDRTIEAGVDSITVSFKSPTRELFKKDTGVDMFETQCKAMRNVGDSQIHCVMNVTACDTLLENLDSMIEIAKDINVNSFAIDTGKPIFLSGESYADGMGSPKRMAGFFIEANRKLKCSNLRFSLKVAIPFCLFPKASLDELLADGNLMSGCQMQSGNGLIVDPQGRIIPCNHICDKFLGVMGEKGVNDLESYWEYRESEQVSKFFDIAASCQTKKCVSCDYWTKCGGGCKLYWMHYQPKDLVGDFTGGEICCADYSFSSFI